MFEMASSQYDLKRKENEDFFPQQLKAYGRYSLSFYFAHYFWVSHKTSPAKTSKTNQLEQMT